VDSILLPEEKAADNQDLALCFVADLGAPNEVTPGTALLTGEEDDIHKAQEAATTMSVDDMAETN
jgi:hypothetical protein